MRKHPTFYQIISPQIITDGKGAKVKDGKSQQPRLGPPAEGRPGASDDNGDDLIQLMWWCFLPASSHYLPLPSSSIASVRLIQMIVWDHCGPFYNDHSLPIKYIFIQYPPLLRSWWSWLMMAVACGCVVTHTSLNMFHFPILIKKIWR